MIQAVRYWGTFFNTNLQKWPESDGGIFPGHTSRFWDFWFSVGSGHVPGPLPPGVLGTCSRTWVPGKIPPIRASLSRKFVLDLSVQILQKILDKAVSVLPCYQKIRVFLSDYCE